MQWNWNLTSESDSFDHIMCITKISNEVILVLIKFTGVCETIDELKEDCRVELADLVLRPSRDFQFLRPDIQILSVSAAANELQLYLSCNEEL